MSLFDAVLLGIVEGLTEFLPVSSTGHMILTSHLLSLKNTEFLKTFEVTIQLGAILAVVIIYWPRLVQGLAIYYKLFAAFIPTAIIGFFAYSTIKAYLFNPYVVSLALIIGGFVLIFLDKWTEDSNPVYNSLEQISYKGAMQIGLLQSVSMVPGISRAAASIFGGIYAGFDRKQAAEFSFLLAIPTMFAATGYDLLQTFHSIHSDELALLLGGAIVSFVFAWLAVKSFITFVVRFGFSHFGYYRILLGVIFLLFSLLNGLEID